MTTASSVNTISTQFDKYVLWNTMHDLIFTDGYGRPLLFDTEAETDYYRMNEQKAIHFSKLPQHLKELIIKESPKL
jgi:hypothetical protein